MVQAPAGRRRDDRVRWTTLDDLRRAAADCTACDLWKRATRTVFGEGGGPGGIVLVGEQPGDAEDLAGKPFVGPAGRLLDKALSRAGIDRSQAYVTNAVKHFNWSETRGKKRIHKKPNASQVAACHPWLNSEINLVRPHVVVLMGATAVESVLGKGFAVTKDRGRLIKSPFAPCVLITVHPSSILRAPDDESRRLQMQMFTDDLRKAGEALMGGEARERAAVRGL